MPASATAVRVGDRFAAILTEWLGEAIMAQVRQDNTGREDGSCAAHDHCDANEAMSEAFTEIVGREPFTPHDNTDRDATSDEQELDCLLWNAAYRHATAQHLTNKES
jgi:hypothetical protein